MKRFVLDASLALAWAIDTPQPDIALQILKSLQSGWLGVVPSLWVLEVANGLVLAERRGRLNLLDAERARTLYENLMLGHIEVQIESVQSSFREFQEIAQKHRLTAYDSSYILLALRQQLPLATLDADMIHAAKTLGIKLLA